MRGADTNGDEHTSSTLGDAQNGTSPHKPASSGAVNGSTNGTTISNGAPSTNGAVAPAGWHTPPTFYGHDREEVTRILIQGLHDLGYAGAATTLSRESGFDLETPYASAFRLAILNGEWRDAEALLLGTFVPHDEEAETEPRSNGHDQQLVKRDSAVYQRPRTGLPLSEEADRAEMLFLIRRQKYLELLEKLDLGAALMVLQQELQPLHQDERQLHALSSLIMCESAEDLKNQADWDGASGDSRKHLLSELSRSISPSVMIPEHRLARLLTHVKDNQVQSCLYHNTANWPSLYFDHHCERDDLPLETFCQLDEHQDEVWFLQFSYDGKKIATASKDKKVIIYDTTSFKPLHVLSDHTEPVAYVSWSPDDARLVTCSQDNKVKIWNTSTGICTRSISWHDHHVTTAAWCHDSQTFATGSHDPLKPLAIWSRGPHSTTPLHAFYDCARVQDVRVTPPTSSMISHLDELDPTSRPVRLVAVCVDKSVHVYNYFTREKLSRIVLDYEITCLNISNDAQEMLVNLGCDEVWTIGLDDGLPRQKYKGQKQGNFVIRSCFGGASQGFVVSGGEDSKISIWHKNSGKLLEKFSGHRTGCVNAVAWNMAKPGMFASAGDDNVVRIWSKPTSSFQRHAHSSETQLQSESALAESREQRAPSRRHSQRNLQSPSQDQSDGLPRWGSGTAASPDGGGRHRLLD